jgi:hypothetical protein
MTTQLKSLLFSLTLGSFCCAASCADAQQPAPDATTNTTTPPAPNYPPAASLTDAQLAKELTDLGATVKTEGDAPDGAIVEITFLYTHKASPSPTGAMVPPYRVTDDLVARIAKLPKLTHLELNMCPKLTNAGFVTLKGMPQLQYLSLPNGRTDDTTMTYLAGLTNLTGFRMGGATRMTPAGWAVAVNFKKLTKFWCPEGSFGDEDMQYLKGLPLQTITFYGTKVTNASADALLAFPDLTAVRLGNRFSADTVAKLHAALPKCQITTF